MGLLSTAVSALATGTARPLLGHVAALAEVEDPEMLVPGERPLRLVLAVVGEREGAGSSWPMMAKLDVDVWGIASLP